MVKKLFALASISALTGIVITSTVSGCSSTTTTADPPAAAAAPDSSKPVTPKDAAPPDDAATGPTTCPTNTAITAADIEANVKWVPPLAPQNVCTQTNIDSLKAQFLADKAAGKTGTLFTDIKAALGGAGTACVKCAFGPQAAQNWPPYVELTGGGTLSNRTASCLAQVESAACGKAYFEFDFCLAQLACNTKDCTTSAAVTACEKTAGAKGGACYALGQEFATACPNFTANVDPAGPCASSPAAIAASCSAYPDGGSLVDASL
jgi:hypothetical protein